MSASESQSAASVELRSLIGHVPALAWSALQDGSLGFLNQRFEDFTGFTADQLHGLQWKSIVHCDDIQQLEVWWQEVPMIGPATSASCRMW